MDSFIELLYNFIYINEAMLNYKWLFVVPIIFGLCFGSFLNVLVFRTPINKNVIFPSSCCLKCGEKLKFYHNIPLISYLFLKGKCAFCKKTISIIYPIVEVFSALITYFIYLKVGFGIAFLFLSISILLLMALSIIDYKFQEVPDSINFSSLAFGFLGSVFNNNDITLVFINLLTFAGFFTLLRFSLQNFFKKEVLGEGDIIVIATMGAILGYKLTILAVFLGSLFALFPLIVLRNENLRVAYIPFLFLGTIVCFLFSDYLDSIIYRIYGI